MPVSLRHMIKTTTAGILAAAALALAPATHAAPPTGSFGSPGEARGDFWTPDGCHIAGLLEDENDAAITSWKCVEGVDRDGFRYWRLMVYF
ncbi:hypothetical protein [Nocardia sp. NPDC050406]|uniref:hypothetical protein n=1 Tax=Nocardia sp. NPDC050406 TaxID=3364318 RepID=UPI0037909B45